MTTEEESPAVTRFREYLRIKTDHPDPDYASVVDFLKNQAIEIGLQCMVMEVYSGRPVVIMTWEGLNPQLPSIMLNSHTDVVPVFPDFWHYEPFEAVKTPDGKIYARGTQDMKSVGMQYLEVIRLLKQSGQRLLRTIHITFVPDEEIGGNLGMSLFVKTDVFKRMNVGFALDEGYASPYNYFYVFYGDRICWWLKITCQGNPGHGSRFIENTAAEKMRKIVNSFLDFRDKEKQRLEENDDLTLGDVTTVNLNMLNGGVQVNVVPSDMTAVFDIRISPNVNLPEFEKMILSWITDAGDDITYEFLQKSPAASVTSINPDNPWWRSFSESCINMNIDVKCEIFPAATDSRYLRQLGYPALGFSPINNTPILLHDHDEYLEERVYLQGINIYSNLIPALANVPQTSSIPSVPRVSPLQSLSSVHSAVPIASKDYSSPLITLPSKGNVYLPANIPSIGHVPLNIADSSLNNVPSVNFPSVGNISQLSNIQLPGNVSPRTNMLPQLGNAPSGGNIHSASNIISPSFQSGVVTSVLSQSGSPPINVIPPMSAGTVPSQVLMGSNIQNVPSMGDTFPRQKLADKPIISEINRFSSTSGDVIIPRSDFPPSSNQPASENQPQ